MKIVHSNKTNDLNHVRYKWYQQWWFIVLVIITIPTNYGFSILLVGFLMYSRMRTRKSKHENTYKSFKGE